MADNQAQIRALLHKQDYDRFTASQFAPDSARPRIHALLAFNYEIARAREIANENLAGQVRLQWWRDAVNDIRKSNIRRQYAVQELAQIPDLDFAALHAMIDARAREFDESINSTVADFTEYCENTSGILQQLCTAGNGNPEYSRAIGTAYAAIGVMRAVGFHARFRRMYLPVDLLARHGIDPARFFDLPSRVDLSPVCREIADASMDNLTAQCSKNAFSKNPFDKAVAESAAIHYRRLKQCGFNPLHPQLHRPMPFKALKMWLAA